MSVSGAAKISGDLPRSVALFAACLHHGLSNLSPKALPPHAGTVVNTARIFERYLRTGDAQQNGTAA